jgi:hypothetical protein
VLSEGAVSLFLSVQSLPLKGRTDFQGSSQIPDHRDYSRLSSAVGTRSSGLVSGSLQG